MVFVCYFATFTCFTFIKSVILVGCRIYTQSYIFSCANYDVNLVVIILKAAQAVIITVLMDVVGVWMVLGTDTRNYLKKILKHLHI